MANGSGPSSEDITRDLHISIDECLATSMEGKIEKLDPLSRNCCIYRVPKRLRQVNKKAYTPLVVSIGPLHHGTRGLEAMEEHKWRYLKDFVKRSRKPIVDFVEYVRKKEGEIRECYAETISLDSDKFVEIILVDAAFVIEIFLRKYRFDVLISDDDHIYGKPWMINDIKLDLLLLENQIPFFVLEGLFSMANITETPTTFMELTRKFLAHIVGLTDINRPEKEEINPSKVKHLIDFLRSCLIPRESMLSQLLTAETEIESIHTATGQTNGCSEIGCLTDFLRSCFIPRESMLSQRLTMETETETETETLSQRLTMETETETETEMEFKLIRTATELKKAGVKFKASFGKHLFDIKFSGGILEVPRIRITDDEERYLRNLVAFEQCHYEHRYMADYVSLMDDLINTSEDVGLLVRSGVIENCLADSQVVCNLFNKLSDGIILDNSHFAQLRKELYDHCRNRCNKWKAILRHDYCNTPWRVLSIVVAAILLLLTFLQTVYSII